MNIKAEFVHIAPVSLSSDFPLKKILEVISRLKAPTLSFSDAHQILSEAIPDFSEAHSALFFTKAKLLFDPSVSDFTRQTLSVSPAKKTAFKALIYLQLAKNRKDHSKGLMTSWGHGPNPDDSTFLNTSLKPISALKLTIPNFLRDAALATELADPGFEEELAKAFGQPDAKAPWALLEKKGTVEIDFSEFYEIINVSGKVLTLDGAKKPRLFISECSNSNIYFRAGFETLIITRCKNCEIFVPFVGRIALIEHSHDLTVSLVSRAVHISNVNDSVFSIYCGFEPQLLGETINLTFGPFNANFAEIVDMMEKGGLPFSAENANFFATPSTFFTAQKFLDHKKNSFTVLSPENFESLVLPKEFLPVAINSLIVEKMLAVFCKEIEGLLKENADCSLTLPIFAPVKYKEAVLKRWKAMKGVKQMLAEAKMSKEQETVVLEAIQGYFREWLISKPHSTAALIRTLNSFNPKF